MDVEHAALRPRRRGWFSFEHQRRDAMLVENPRKHEPTESPADDRNR